MAQRSKRSSQRKLSGYRSTKRPNGVVGPARWLVLRICGDKLNPEDLTALLGPPTRSYAKGAPVKSGVENPMLGVTGVWELSTQAHGVGDCPVAHASYLWGRLEPHEIQLDRL